MLRLRYAPSPTGKQHLGGLRTLLYNYLYAKKMGGSLILRIEDTDAMRKWDGALADLEDVASTFAIPFDEGPPLKGVLRPSEEYFQSSRLHHYHKYVEILLKKGYAYRCYCSKERLSFLKWGYDGRCRYNAGARASADSSNFMISKPHVVRFDALSVRRAALSNPLNTLLHEDLVLGFRKDLLKAPLEHGIDNIILLKADRFPTYHLASVVDDHLMRITTVLRGSEWLSSTPLHLYLYASLDLEAPEFGHLPLLLGGDGKKLSKRAAFSGNIPPLEVLKEKYLPDAICNFISSLGYHHPRGEEEVKGRPELIDTFSLKNIGKSPAVVDEDKLRWFNREHMKRFITAPSTPSTTTTSAKTLTVPSYSPEYVKSVIECLSGREDEWTKIKEGYFFCHPTPPPLLTAEERSIILSSNGAALFENLPKKLLRKIVCGSGVSGPPLAEIIRVLGADVVRERIRRVLETGVYKMV